MVIIDATDQPIVHSQSLLTLENLKKIGINAEIQAGDWGTLITRRAVKEPPDKGGWNIFHTWLVGPDMVKPAVSSVLGGAGDKAWFGWPTSEPIEKLRAQFTREADPARRKALADEVQKIAYDEVLYVPWGQFVIPGAFRKNVRGVLEFGATLLWNIQV